MARLKLHTTRHNGSPLNHQRLRCKINRTPHPASQPSGLEWTGLILAEVLSQYSVKLRGLPEVPGRMDAQDGSGQLMHRLHEQGLSLGSFECQECEPDNRIFIRCSSACGDTTALQPHEYLAAQLQYSTPLLPTWPLRLSVGSLWNTNNSPGSCPPAACQPTHFLPRPSVDLLVS